VIDHVYDIRMSVSGKEGDLVLEAATLISSSLIRRENLHGDLRTICRRSLVHSARTALAKNFLNAVATECGF